MNYKRNVHVYSENASSSQGVQGKRAKYFYKTSLPVYKDGPLKIKKQGRDENTQDYPTPSV